MLCPRRDRVPLGILESGLLSNPLFLPPCVNWIVGILRDSQDCLQSERAAHEARRSQVVGPSPGDPVSEPPTAAGHCPYCQAKRALLSVSDGATAALPGEGRPVGGK